MRSLDKAKWTDGKVRQRQVVTRFHDVQKPNNLRASLAATKSNDVTANAVVQKSTLLLVGLGKPALVSRNNVRAITLTEGSTLAINWLPVTDKARSTIMALLALQYGPWDSVPVKEEKRDAYPLAGSHILLTTRSKVSFPPSFKAFVTDLDPCSLVANSSKPSSKWSKVIWRCFSEPCSRTMKGWSEKSTGQVQGTHCVGCSTSPTGSLRRLQTRLHHGWGARRRCHPWPRAQGSRRHAKEDY